MSFELVGLVVSMGFSDPIDQAAGELLLSCWRWGSALAIIRIYVAVARSKGPRLVVIEVAKYYSWSISALDTRRYFAGLVVRRCSLNRLFAKDIEY